MGPVVTKGGPQDAPEPPPDAGDVEPVAGTQTGLVREVGRMADGRRITYYSLPDPSPSSGARAGGGA